MQLVVDVWAGREAISSLWPVGSLNYLYNSLRLFYTEALESTIFLSHWIILATPVECQWQLERKQITVEHWIKPIAVKWGISTFHHCSFPTLLCRSGLWRLLVVILRAVLSCQASLGCSPAILFQLAFVLLWPCKVCVIHLLSPFFPLCFLPVKVRRSVEEVEWIV